MRVDDVSPPHVRKKSIMVDEIASDYVWGTHLDNDIEDSLQASITRNCVEKWWWA